MSQETRAERIDTVRRKLLKSSMVAGGFLAAGHLPYSKPAAKSFFGVRSAWAQPTGVNMITIQPDPSGPGKLGGLNDDPGDPADTGQDCFQIEVLEASTQLTVTAAPVVTNHLNLEIFLYGPNPGPAPYAGTNNVFTGDPFGLDMTGLGGIESATVTVGSAGTYVIAVEDGRSAPNQQAGTYSLTISSDKPITGGTQICDEGMESE